MYFSSVARAFRRNHSIHSRWPEYVYWACNSINQERRSLLSALVLANRIQMCASGNFSFHESRFSLHCRFEERSSPFLSSHKIAFATFSFSIPIFPILSSTRFSLLELYYLPFELVLEQFSINTLTTFSFIWPERSVFLFPSMSYPCSPKAAFADLYRMRGLTDFARTAPIGNGKKLLEIFDWLTPFFLPSASSIPQTLSQSVFAFLLDQSFRFDFYR